MMEELALNFIRVWALMGLVGLTLALCAWKDW